MNTQPIDNLMLSGAQSHLERRLHRACLAGMAYEQLHTEFLHAFGKGPETMLRTPDFNVREMSVADIVNDAFAGRDGTEMLNQLLRIARMVATMESPKEAQKAMLSWLDCVATRHALYHKDEVAKEMEWNES